MPTASFEPTISLFIFVVSAYRNYVFLELFEARNVPLAPITYKTDFGPFEDEMFVHIMCKDSLNTLQTRGVFCTLK